MKTYIMEALLLFGLVSCDTGRMSLRGDIGSLQEDRIYLGVVTGPFHGSFKVIDSAEVRDGRFRMDPPETAPQCLFLGFRPGEGAYLFTDRTRMEVRLVREEDGKMDWDVSGSGLNRLYSRFRQERTEVRKQRMLDSLERIFYAARDRDDRKEMERIKLSSMHFYEEAEQAEDSLVRLWVEANRDNVLGICLYRRRLFPRKEFHRSEDIRKEREYLSRFGGQAVQSPYLKEMEMQLDRHASCAVGAQAPGICGTDTLGNTLQLSDFRGKYVLVDFWNSYCHWCREETPWLKKALEAFKDKEFTILGVSDDTDRERWTAAIRQDGSLWNHLIIPKGDGIFRRYCIKGIPHIILVGPDGRILAKELRHEDLIRVTEGFIP